MSNSTHIIALIAAAVVIATILTLGTLAAADLLPSRYRRKRHREAVREPQSGRQAARTHDR